MTSPILTLLFSDDILLKNMENKLNQLTVLQEQQAEFIREAFSGGSTQLSDLVTQINHLSQQVNDITHNRENVTATSVEERSASRPRSTSHSTTAPRRSLLFYTSLFIGFIVFFSLGRIQAGCVYRSAYGYHPMIRTRYI